MNGHMTDRIRPGYWHRHSLAALLAGTAALAAAMSMAVPAASAQTDNSTDQKRANDQNTMKAVGAGAGALSLWELLHGRGTNALILGAGAAYAGKKYEDDRKAQQADEAAKEQRERDRRTGELNPPNKYRVQDGTASSASLPPQASLASPAPIHVSVNGSPVDFAGKEPEMSSGSVYVPMRGVLEKLGAYVEWDPQNHSVIARRGDKFVTLPMDSRTATVDGNQMALDTPAYISEGSTMVPLRFLAQTFGAKVDWDARDRDVRIFSHDSHDRDRGG